MSDKPAGMYESGPSKKSTVTMDVGLHSFVKVGSKGDPGLAAAQIASLMNRVASLEKTVTILQNDLTKAKSRINKMETTNYKVRGYGE